MRPWGTTKVQRKCCGSSSRHLWEVQARCIYNDSSRRLLWEYLARLMKNDSRSKAWVSEFLCAHASECSASEMMLCFFGYSVIRTRNSVCRRVMRLLQYWQLREDQEIHVIWYGAALFSCRSSPHFRCIMRWSGHARSLETTWRPWNTYNLCER